MNEQRALLARAEESLGAASLLLEKGYYGFAVSRAYYAMFYVAQAFLHSEDLTFSSHSAVIAAFGKHFIRTGELPRELHRYLIDAQDDRLTSDYDIEPAITPSDAEKRIAQAETFINYGKQRFIESA